MRALEEASDQLALAVTVRPGETGFQMPPSGTRGSGLAYFFEGGIAAFLGSPGKFVAQDAEGNWVSSSGTGADAGLRDDLATGDGSLVSMQQDLDGAVARSMRIKWGEFVSVDDFGAIGDGTLHTVQEWIVPGVLGRYLSLAALQVDYPHVTSTSASIDWAAIQAGWNTVSGRGGGKLWHAAKIYVLSNTAGGACLTARSNVDLVGSSTVYKLGAAAGACSLIRSEDAVWNIHVEGITFDGNRATVLTDTYGIRLENITGLTINRCKFKNLRNDPVLVGQATLAKQVTIDNSIFEHTATPGVGVNAVRVYHNRGVTVNNCRFYGFISSPIDTNPTPGGDEESSISITKCTMVQGDGWIAGHSSISLLADHVVCDDNTVIGGGMIVVHDYSGSGYTTQDYRITGNGVFGATNGIIIFQGENSRILATGNIVVGFEQFGIEIINTAVGAPVHPATVANNIVFDTSDDVTYTTSNQPVCILLAYANNVLCTGNQTYSARFAGIWSAGSSNCKIFGNTDFDHRGHAPTDLLTFTGAPFLVSPGGFGAPVDVTNVIVDNNTAVNFLTALAGSPTTNHRSGGVCAFNDTGGAVTMEKIFLANNKLLGGNGVGVRTHELDSVWIDGNEEVDCLGGAELDTGSIYRIANAGKGSYASAPAGTYPTSTRIYDNNPVAGGFIGWVWTAADGWKTWGAISA
jgi:parallel beta-helix repeat protein